MIIGGEAQRSQFTTAKRVEKIKMNSKTEVYHVPHFDGSTFPQGMTRHLQEILDKASGAAFYRSFMDFTFKPDDRYNFDTFAAKLNGAAKQWFHKSFSSHERHRVKPFDTLVDLFQSKFMEPEEGELLLAMQDIHTLLSEHASAISQFKIQNKTVEILVDRIQKLEHSISKFDDQKAIISDLQAKNRILESNLLLLEEKLSKVSSSKSDTFKSLKDRQENVQKEIAALKPMFDQENATLKTKVHSIEESCEDHKHLLDEVQLKITALTEALKETATVETAEIIHVATPVSHPVKEHCDLCGSNTHSSATCGARRLRCRQCFRVGHLARCCPMIQQENQCHRCGLQSHSIDQCGTFGLQCWRCGMTGHLQRMCQQPLRYHGNYRVS